MRLVSCGIPPHMAFVPWTNFFGEKWKRLGLKAGEDFKCQRQSLTGHSTTSLEYKNAERTWTVDAWLMRDQESQEGLRSLSGIKAGQEPFM